MRFIGSSEDRQPTPAKALGIDSPFTRYDAREVFRQIVDAELRNGHLSAHRRKRLIQYAAILCLTPLDAGRIISNAFAEHRRLHPDTEQTTNIIPFPIEPPRRRKSSFSWPYSLTIGLTLLAIFLLSMVLDVSG